LSHSSNGAAAWHTCPSASTASTVCLTARRMETYRSTLRLLYRGGRLTQLDRLAYRLSVACPSGYSAPMSTFPQWRKSRISLDAVITS
jgi:hypothetical protein